jgi:hypothetical protein
VGNGEPTGWGAWARFAGVLIIISGLAHAILAFGGILHGESVAFRQGGEWVLSVEGWSWVTLVLGIALIAVGAGVLGAASWARWAAVVVVGLSLLEQFSLIGLHPGFSVILIGLGVLVLYALIARWEGPLDTYRGP